MFKLNKSELKKIFLRPAVYVMLFLLSAALVVSVFLYAPAPRQDQTTNFGGPAETVAMAFSAFNSSASQDAKPALDQTLDAAKQKLEEFSSQASIHSLLQNELSAIEYSLTHRDDATQETFDLALYNYSILHTDVNKQKLFVALDTLSQKANLIYQTCKNEINASTIDFYVQAEDLQIVQDYAQKLFLAIYTQDVLNEYEYEQLITYCNNLKSSYLPTQAKNIIDQAELIVFDSQKVSSILDQYYAPVAFSDTQTTVLTEIYAEIQAFVAENADKQTAEMKANFNKLTTQYKIATQTAINLIETSFVLEKAGDYADVQLEKFIGFENYNSYALNETIVLNTYLLENKVFDGQYLLGFNFNTSSGYTTSAYDFCVYAMQILGVILIVFALYFGVTIMAGDFQNGTIKMLATRPLSRTQIVAGKTMACINFSLIFALFALVASFVVGFAMFGFGSGEVVLTVFNATTVLALHPAVLLGIYFISTFLNIIFFVLIGMFFAVLFRSSVGALISGFLVLATHLVLSAMFVGASWFVFTPFAHLDLFRFFGGASVSGGFLTIGTTLGGSFLVSIGVFLGMIVLVDVLSKLIFKTRDIT